MIILVAVLWTIVFALAGYLIWSSLQDKNESAAADGSGGEVEPGSDTGGGGTESGGPVAALPLITDAEGSGDSLKTSDGWGVIRIPQINLDSAEVRSINQEIYNRYYTNIAEGWLDSNSPEGSIRYYNMTNGDILSLVVEYTRPENEFASYSVYNVSISEEKAVDDSTLIAYAGVSDYEDTVKKALEADFYNTNYYSVDLTSEDACDWYNTQLDETRSSQNVRQAKPYLNENGQLCAAVYIYRLAVSPNWKLINLEGFHYESIYSRYLIREGPSSEYLLPDSNKRLILTRELEGFTEDECWLALNELYARHGRLYGDGPIGTYFKSKSWYHGTIPGEEFDAHLEEYLNEYELQNIDIICAYMRKKGWRS